MCVQKGKVIRFILFKKKHGGDGRRRPSKMVIGYTLAWIYSNSLTAANPPLLLFFFYVLSCVQVLKSVRQEA